MHAAPSLSGRSVVVTGAGGFIGSHLVERLVADGARVRAFVRYNGRGDRGNLELVAPETLAEVEVLFGDLRDPWSVEKAVAEQDVVFHLGALIAIPYSYQAPADVLATNVGGTLAVLQAALRRDGTRVVHTSTSEVYGTAETVPINERHRLHAQSPYAASKVGADQLALSFHLSFGLPVATVRPFNCFGPRQSARALVPTVITQALFADELKLGALDPTRDLTFVSDTVDAFVRASLSDAALGEVMNIGTGSDVSVRRVVERVLALVGRDLPIRHDPARVRPDRSEVKQLVCDSTAARRIIGWEPRHSLDEGLRKTIDWVAAHPDRYRTGEYAT